MSVKPAAIVLLFGCGLLIFSRSSAAAGPKNKPAKPDPESPAVAKVLRAEVAGQVDRRAALTDALNTTSDSSLARWQAGFVKVGGDWCSFDDPARDSDSRRVVEEYEQRRNDAAKNVTGQLELADWCRAHKLPDREQAHLHAALVLAGGDKSGRIAERLGYRQIAGRWLSPEQILEWNELNSQAMKSLKKWESPIRKLTDRLSGTPAQVEQAIASFKKLADNSAIPAIEYLLAGQDEETALVAIALLRSREGFEASRALARQAVFSPWAAVRASAGESLKGRALDHFVPDLLGLLGSSIRWEWQFYERPDTPGVLYYNLIQAQETQNQFQVAVLTTADHTLANARVITVGLASGIRSIVPDPVGATSPLSVTNRDRAVRERLHARDEVMVRQNELIDETNRRVGRVLEVVSGEPATSELQDWWRWWAGYADLEDGSTKEITVVTEEEDVTSPPPIKWIITPSCFAAGTPVWTESGAVSIETIKVGDRVLAKDIETGELAYKPVLQTTVRPPKELTTLRFGDETIVCTGGHRFWRSGSGWTKARDLTEQTLLHTVTGNTPVWSAKKGNTAETFNLVVADFHTYFVGKTGVLCQDLLIPRATNSIVPGFARR